ncbi:hypothetical protein C8R44DRAFT_124413 [Mycena epipterygia]|nr:hypothetical protein C8R44DRAFT_124413 [Mycena epipterygia]
MYRNARTLHRILVALAPACQLQNTEHFHSAINAACLEKDKPRVAFNRTRRSTINAPFSLNFYVIHQLRSTERHGATMWTKFGKKPLCAYIQAHYNQVYGY